jgi:hypothetical protein
MAITSIIPREVFTERLLTLMPTVAICRFSQVSKETYAIVQAAIHAPQVDITLAEERVTFNPGSIPGFVHHLQKMEFFENHPELSTDIVTHRKTYRDALSSAGLDCNDDIYLFIGFIKRLHPPPSFRIIWLMGGTILSFLPYDVKVQRVFSNLTAMEIHRFSQVSRVAYSTVQTAAEGYAEPCITQFLQGIRKREALAEEETAPHTNPKVEVTEQQLPEVEEIVISPEDEDGLSQLEGMLKQSEVKYTFEKYLDILESLSAETQHVICKLLCQAHGVPSTGNIDYDGRVHILHNPQSLLPIIDQLI